MQLPIGLLFSVLSAVNGLLPLTSPTRFASIPFASFHPHSHILGVSSTSPTGYLPTQIRTAYGLTPSSPQGEGKSIAIVGAYTVPNLTKDLATFNARVHLLPMNGTEGRPSCTALAGPHPCLEIHTAGTLSNAGWGVEAALDTEWSHAIAPKADIIVVQASDPSARSLAAAVTLAASMKTTTASMSWGGAEFSHEKDWDATFAKTRFVASSGDQGTGASFPATSPSVLSVGGTSLSLNAAGKRTAAERAWPGSGGGSSLYEQRPSYQMGAWLPVTGQKRLIPDVSYNADPKTGYAVFAGGKWLTVGGTSAGAPQWAAFLTLGKTPLNNTSLYKIGSSSNHKAVFTDILIGNNGHCSFLCLTRPGFDEVTGFGTPLGNGLIKNS